ncbi:glutamate racemase [Aliidiomarina soli]|uniref:Glutamate racemase n=1 Tax=Aliidiomarina soli TaxID=1928574 RepID=A0A432WHI8_9GAMM|nr:glutamate racemase [Aliidiomarina soli]RUO33244.1 glutamate racemase [Aliidiomarina soli]
MRIAFFDSGIGGLTVLAEAQRQQPAHEYLYYADSEHAPYGAKPAAEVRDRVLQAADFLAGQQLDALVIACNTATSVCIKELRLRFSFPVIGMEPAVKPALQRASKKRVMVMATSLTLQESKLSQLLQRLDGSEQTDKLAMDMLVTFAEQQTFDSPEVTRYLQHQLSHYRLADYSAVVLGCTHFIYFRNALQTMVGDSVTLIDGNQGTVKQLFALLQQTNDEHSQHSKLRGEGAAPLRVFRSGIEQPLAPYLELLRRCR